MAIGKLLPVLLRRYAPSAYRPARTFAAGKLGHLVGLGNKRRSVFKLLEASSTRRCHSRKRNVKPVLMDVSIIRFSANCLRVKLNFSQIGLFTAGADRLTKV